MLQNGVSSPLVGYLPLIAGIEYDTDHIGHITRPPQISIVGLYSLPLDSGEVGVDSQRPSNLVPLFRLFKVDIDNQTAQCCYGRHLFFKLRKVGN
jgi:hypothetical protein